MCWIEGSGCATLNQKNKPELFDALQEEWQRLEPATYAKLVQSMPRRVNAVIRANGNPTRY